MKIKYSIISLMFSAPRMVAKIGIIVALVAVFSFYGLYRTKDFLQGPKIAIEYPKNGEVVSNSDIEIRGEVKNISLLYLNGRQIFTDKNGKFKENLLLARGYNIIKVSAKDKFNREIKITREVVLK